MRLKPIGNRVIVKVIVPEEKTKSGIILAESAIKPSSKATVISIGEGRRLDSGETAPINVAVGDVILFDTYGGTKITEDNVDYLILNARDIQAIVEE
jgi:chaperonin GroES